MAGDDSASDHSADDYDLLRAADGYNIQISPDEECIADLTVGGSSTDGFLYCTVCRDRGQRCCSGRKDQYTVNFVLHHYNAGDDHDLSSAVLML